MIFRTINDQSFAGGKPSQFKNKQTNKKPSPDSCQLNSDLFFFVLEGKG